MSDPYVDLTIFILVLAPVIVATAIYIDSRKLRRSGSSVPLALSAISLFAAIVPYLAYLLTENPAFRFDEVVFIDSGATAYAFLLSLVVFFVYRFLIRRFLQRSSGPEITPEISGNTNVLNTVTVILGFAVAFLFSLALLGLLFGAF